MNIISNNVVAKLTVAFVAAAMLFALATPSQAAMTADEIAAMIADLTAELAALQEDAPAPAAGACTFTRSLTDGSEGADVTCLQDYLTSTGHFTFAGGSTGYFGPVTTAAVAAWQAANGVAPAVGYFGPVSQAAYSDMMAAMPPVMDDDEDDSDDESDDSDMTLSGEASYDGGADDLDDAEDDELEEGANDAEIGLFTMEFDDGDALVTRLDIALVGSGDEQDPWDTFDEISLWVDDEMIADFDATDEDEYLDEDAGEIRFSGLDIFAEEDEEVEVSIRASVQGSVDGTNDGEAWTVDVTGLRFVDGDDVTSTETPSVAAASFSIEDEGVDDELTAKTSTNDPDSTTLPVEDSSDSDWYTVFVFDLDTDDSENDIEINEIVLNVLTAENTTAADAGYDDLVDDVELTIDGVPIDDVTIGGTSASAGTATLTFDVDGDVVITAGDRVEVELDLKFNSLPAAEEGATVQASISSLTTLIVDAEGADDLGNSQLGGSATGDVHTLRTEGLILDITDITATESLRDTGSGDLDYGTFVFEFDVTAFEQDFYTDEDPDVVNYVVYEDGVAVAAASSTATLSINEASAASTADKLLSDGQAAEYVFTVETDTTFSGNTEVVIVSVDYSAADDITEELNVTANPADDWTSAQLILN